MSIKRFKTLYNSATAGSSDWIQLDTRYENQSNRVLNVVVVAGDTVKVEATAYDPKGGDRDDLASLSTDEITTLSTVSSTGSYQITGSWPYIRVTKTGTAGIALVEGFI